VTAAAAISGIAATAAYLDAKFHIRNDFKIGNLNNAAAESFAFIAKKQAENKLLNYHVLEWWAEQDKPNHVFLQFEGAQWTYKQFYLEVQRVGNWLMNDLGIERDEIVALDGRNSNSYVLLWFALEGIGACPAFINSNLTSDSLVHCVKVSRILTVIEDFKNADCLPASWFQVLDRGESYRATGGALSRQPCNRERADSILRR
jgi:acyl-CoA synthetase (AMP-forming)/AMP-acid ligase II